LGENIVLVQKVFMTVGKIEYGDAHRPVEIAVDIANRSFEFLPESLLLFLRRRSGVLGSCQSARQETNNQHGTREFASNSRSLATLRMTVRQGCGCNTVSSGHSPQIFASRRRFTAVSDVTGE